MSMVQVSERSSATAVMGQVVLVDVAFRIPMSVAEGERLYKVKHLSSGAICTLPCKVCNGRMCVYS